MAALICCAPRPSVVATPNIVPEDGEDVDGVADVAADAVTEQRVQGAAPRR